MTEAALREVNKDNLEAALEIALSAAFGSPRWTAEQRDGARFLTKTLCDYFGLAVRVELERKQT
jgi:hypothetical protein